MSILDMTTRPPRPNLGQLVHELDSDRMVMWDGDDWVRVRCACLFLDCETTGLRPDRHTIWEIAYKTALHLENGKLHVVTSREYMPFLTPQERTKADPNALAIGRFPERWRATVPKEAVMTMLKSDCRAVTFGHHVPHLVGAVPSFDHSMLAVNYLGWPDYGQGLWHYRLICWENLAAAKLGIPPGWSTSELLAGLGIEENPDTKHSAMGDVETAIAAYAAIFGLEVL